MKLESCSEKLSKNHRKSTFTGEHLWVTTGYFALKETNGKRSCKEFSIIFENIQVNLMSRSNLFH